MHKRTIATDIRDTGFAVRDWLGPYYTLGGAVAFGIALLTVLDPGGRLARAVGALLLLFTLLAWVRHLYLQRTQKGAAAPQQASAGDGEHGPVKLHAILLAVTVFFGCGIVLSEALMARRGHGEPATPAAAPAPSQPAPPAGPSTAAVAPVQPAPAAPAASVPAQTAAPTASSAAPSAAAPAAEPPGARQPAASHAAPAPRTPARKAQPAPQPALSQADQQRCTGLLGRFSLGEELQHEDKRFLETSCR